MNQTHDNKMNARMKMVFALIAAAMIAASITGMHAAAPPAKKKPTSPTTAAESSPASAKTRTPRAKAKTPSKKSIARPTSRSKSKAKPRAKKSTKTGSASTRKSDSKTTISKSQADANKLVSSLTSTQKKKLLALLNEADVDGLTAISGVGKSRGVAITKARPFESVQDVRGVKGVGQKLFSDLVSHGKTLTRPRGGKSADASSTKSKAKPKSARSTPKKPSKAGNKARSQSKIRTQTQKIACY